MLAVSEQWLDGGFLGAILTLSVAWYLTRPTSITYTLTTTTLGADPTVKSMIPDLKIQIGTKEVPTLHTHAIQITAFSGRYMEKADLAIQWNNPVTFYGIVNVEAPSLSHKTSCQTEALGATCSLSPIVPNIEPYRIAMTTNESRPPSLQLVAKDMEFLAADRAARRQENWSVFLISISNALIYSGIILGIGHLIDRLYSRKP